MPPSHAPVPAAVGLFDRMADAVYLLDPGTSRIVWGNRAAWESLGLSAQEVLDHSVLSLQKDVTGLPQWNDIAAAIRATECFTFVGRHRHAAGHEVAVEVYTTRLLDDGREYFLSVARDISRRLALEADLKKRENQLWFALNEASDGLWDWDIRSSEVFFSPQLKRMLGYGPDEMEPRLDTWTRNLHPDDDLHTDSYAYTNAECHRNLHLHTFEHPNGDLHAIQHTNADSDLHVHPVEHADEHLHSDTFADSSTNRHAGSDPHASSHTDLHSHLHGDLHPDADFHAHAHADSDAEQYIHTYPHFHRLSHPHVDPLSHAYKDTHPLADADSHTHTDLHRHTDSDPYPDSNAHPDSDSHPVADPNPYPDSNAHPDSDSHPDPDSTPDQHPHCQPRV